MITLTRGIGDRNEGRGEEERVFVSSLFLPVPRIPFLPDARNLQPSVFFFSRASVDVVVPRREERRRSMQLRGPLFQPAFFPSFSIFFFFPFPPINDMIRIVFPTHFSDSRKKSV